jgi:hypothetical protein
VLPASALDVASNIRTLLVKGFMILTHLHPHDLPIGLCVTAWATTPFDVSVVEQLQLLALHSAITALHAHPQSLLQGEMVLDTPSSEHEQLIASQCTVLLTAM